MGDMADMLIDQGIQQMIDQEFEDEDTLGVEHSYVGEGAMSVRTTHCKYCHARRLRWTKTEAGWRMIGMEGNIHSCKEYRDAKKQHDPDPNPNNGDWGADPAQLGE